MTRRLCLTLLASAAAPIALATVIRVPNNYTQIQAAIDAAADGDLVQVTAGTWGLEMNKRVTSHPIFGPSSTDAYSTRASVESAAKPGSLLQ